MAAVLQSRSTDSSARRRRDCLCQRVRSIRKPSGEEAFRMRVNAALLGLVLTATSGLAFSQNKPAGTQQRETPKASQERPAPGKEDVVRISVTLVQIDAVVTDQQGKQVTDLKPSDFEIYEDGRRQHVTNVSYIGTQPDS